ncbi:hypothetical protein MTBLM5_110081 [Magnetospirillum sp. LM-5]|nr:hypothetical protein MTBLM5_110081 [Magnetospirillum sp. LM-5]
MLQKWASGKWTLTPFPLAPILLVSVTVPLTREGFDRAFSGTLSSLRPAPPRPILDQAV